MIDKMARGIAKHPKTVLIVCLILNNNKHSLNLVYVEPYTKFSNTIY